MDTPIHQGGQAISKLDGSVIQTPTQPHTTYNTQMGGEYKGGISEGIPREIMFPDFTAARRAAGKPVMSDVRSFQLGAPTQEMNQEWLDAVMTYMDSR